MNSFKKMIFLILPFLFLTFFISAVEDDLTSDVIKEKVKTIKNKIYNDWQEERKFQISYGFVLNTPDFRTLNRFYLWANQNRTGNKYNYDVVEKDQRETVESLNDGYEAWIYFATYLKYMQYGLTTRILWRSLMVEQNLYFTPLNNPNDRQTELSASALIGIRLPSKFMLYSITGILFTIKYDWDKITDNVGWNNYETLPNYFSYHAGIISKTGVDLKFKRFSINIFYQFAIADFSEISDLYRQYTNNEIDNVYIRNKILNDYSRIGIGVNYYIGKKKINN